MKLFNKVRGTMEVVPNVEVNRDIVYVRSNIIAINTEDFKGWQYDETQYGKDEYAEVTSVEQEKLKADVASANVAIMGLMIAGLPPM